MPSEKHSSPRVDQSMFENSIAQQQSPQSSRPGQPSVRRTTGSANPNLGIGSIDSPSSGGQQRLKNAINLGKAVGAKVNDLLRRKEPSHLGDIGVTEVNKNVGAVWSSLDQLNQTAANSHISSFDSFPRLDPPPPTGKKRLPRALKTTQDMMISSDPVVTSPETADSSSFPPSPNKMALIATEEAASGRQGEKEAQDDEREKCKGTTEGLPDDAGTTGNHGQTDGTIGRGDGEDGEESRMEGGMEAPQSQLQLSVPDLIHKDLPLLEPRTKPDSRLASTPCPGKTPYRISLGEDVLLENGTPCRRNTGVNAEEAEPHPDLLSFE
ncbi:uncharacterized protein C1orf226 [Diretmus argenteus]